jgi:PAS domain S-box-containing protein
MLRDVSELKERDAFRDEIERHLESVVVWLDQLDPFRVLHASRTYETIWGRPLSGLYENPRAWIDAIHPDDRPRAEGGIARLRAGEAIDIEFRIVRPDGEERWIRDRGTPFRDARGRLDRAAGIAEDVTEKRAAEAALRKAENRRIAAVLAAERAEARERRSLARDLHDALSQSLALARTKLAGLRDSSGGSEAASRLREIESMIAEADERTRTLTFRLSPPILHDLGLAAAAEWLAEDLQRQFGLRVHVSDAGLPGPLPTEMREALFRSLRELLINVARHARTDKANVELVRDGDTLHITVEDGGVGFDLGRNGAAGFGLTSVRERLEAHGGRLEIHSEPGRGTRARLVVPVSEME